jgi:glycosyltransferase involved in cell wall biosynthesis
MDSKVIFEGNGPFNLPLVGQAPRHFNNGATVTFRAPLGEHPRRQKVLLLVTEDWFVLSHFRPLISALKQVAHAVVVVTRCSNGRGEIEALGARVIDFDFRRRSINLAQQASTVWSLARLLSEEHPDVVHLVAMKPIALGALALKMAPIAHTVVHVTGQGLLGVTKNRILRLYHAAILRLIRSLLRQRSSYLLVENSDDLVQLRRAGADPGDRCTILGGAGVDPKAFPLLAPPNNSVPVAAFVGRLIASKGVDLLMSAYDRVRARGVPLQLELFGDTDTSNRAAIAPEVVQEWCARSGARWHGHVSSVADVWRRADFFVLPSRGGEGLPRAMLEAASCGRPLIVTDVPGCRHFVREGVEGLLVPAEDVGALADALHRLASDQTLRLKMGNAARVRLLDGFTEAHVIAALLSSYRSVSGATTLGKEAMNHRISASGLEPLGSSRRSRLSAP